MSELLAAAIETIETMLDKGKTARQIVDSLIADHGGSRTYPSYRTAFKCGGVSTSAAASCDLRTHELLLKSWLEKVGDKLGWRVPAVEVRW